MASLFADEETSIRRIDADIEAARAEEAAEKQRTEDRIGWTPERAKLYDLGHTWADVSAYPCIADLLFLPVDEWKDPIESWGFPLKDGYTERRRQTYQATQDDLTARAKAYEDLRMFGAKALTEYDLSLARGNEFEIAHIVRGSLALAYNHVIGDMRRLKVMRRILAQKGED
jgi:hypothetical protein